MSEAMLRRLREILPVEAVLPPSDLVSWPTDAPPPPPLVAPDSEEQVAEILKAATRAGWRVVPAGLCTWLDGGGLPEVDLVLSTRNLQEVEDYEPADLTFTAGAGIPVRRLQDVTREEGQWLPLDPPGGTRGSLGALASLGIGGPLRHAYGSPRDLILGLTLVSGDGRILSWGGRVVKNVAGFDITRLSVGSWGALGLITSVSARLFPAPARDLTILVPGSSPETLLPLARTMATSPLPFVAVELLNPVNRVRSRNLGGERGPQTGGTLMGGHEGPALVLRAMGSEANVRALEARTLQTLAREGQWKGDDLTRLEGEESARFHDGLESWEEGADLVLRMSLLPSRLGRILEEIRWLEDTLDGDGFFGDRGGPHSSSSEDPDGEGKPSSGVGGVPVCLAAHVGWGGVRVVVPSLSCGEDALVKRLGATLSALRGRLESAGGSLTLSLSPGRLASEMEAWGTPGPEEGLSRGLKEVFDPARILSPGRLGL